MAENFVIEVLTSITVSSIFTGLLLWLTKSWISERLKSAIKSEYDQKLETHKAQLKCATDTEVEKLKSQLSIAANEHNILFSNLQEKRADVIAETYFLLRAVIDAVNKHVESSIPDITPQNRTDEDKTKYIEQVNNIADSVISFRSFNSKKKIFIPKATVEKLDELDSMLVEVVHKFNTLSNNISPDFDWSSVHPVMKEKITAALGELEDEFRKLLGG